MPEGVLVAYVQEDSAAEQAGLQKHDIICAIDGTEVSSFEKLRRMTGVEIKTIEDVRKNLELIKIHGRGHNLYDIFYGKYRGAAETKLLRDYIAMADRTEFEDILNAIDSFVFFNSRKK